MVSAAQTEAIIHVFAEVARPIILEYFPRRACIASSRITVEVLNAFGIRSRALPVRFVLEAPALNQTYCAGLLPGEHHIIVQAGAFLIDPSYDQALEAFAAAGAMIDNEPCVGVFPSSPEKLVSPFSVMYDSLLEDDTRITISYKGVTDRSFTASPDWRLDHLSEPIRKIRTAMQSVLATA